MFDYLVAQRDRSSNNNMHNKPTLRKSPPQDARARAELALFPHFNPGSSVVFIDNGRTFRVSAWPCHTRRPRKPLKRTSQQRPHLQDPRIDIPLLAELTDCHFACGCGLVHLCALPVMLAKTLTPYKYTAHIYTTADLCDRLARVRILCGEHMGEDREASVPAPHLSAALRASIAADLAAPWIANHTLSEVESR